MTALAVRTLPVGRHHDGDRLELLVRSANVAFCALRYRFAGWRQEMGLGRARGPGAVGLEDACGRARALRDQIRTGTDPLGEKQVRRVEARRQDEAGRVTVQQAAEASPSRPAAAPAQVPASALPTSQSATRTASAGTAGANAERDQRTDPSNAPMR